MHGEHGGDPDEDLRIRAKTVKRFVKTTDFRGTPCRSPTTS
ncbi:MAG: hypothetical protein U0797_06880 [Gemmataceae bacterium]